METKTDARKLDGATPAHLRRLVVKARALRARKPKRRGRRAGEGRLDATQSARIRALIVGKMPDQLKLPFYLWTRAAVASLIEREYGEAVSLTTMGRYLKAWGMTPQ